MNSWLSCIEREGEIERGRDRERRRGGEREEGERKGGGGGGGGGEESPVQEAILCTCSTVACFMYMYDFIQHTWYTAHTHLSCSHYVVLVRRPIKMQHSASVTLETLPALEADCWTGMGNVFLLLHGGQGWGEVGRGGGGGEHS